MMGQVIQFPRRHPAALTAAQEQPSVPEPRIVQVPDPVASRFEATIAMLRSVGLSPDGAA
jgi:hypothetical protein